MSVTKDSTFAAMAGEKYKMASGVRRGRLALTNVFLVFSFYHFTFSIIFIINK